MSAEAAIEVGGDNGPLLHEGELVGGRYRVERCLGGGGMASVYRAMHEGLDQAVALKVVSPAVRELPGIVARFMREARAATRLKGEHVVRVFDVGTTDRGAPYFVMELLEGKDLAEMLDSGHKASVEEAVDYVLQTCEALAEVHGLGIVHRDLKPANLFVTRGPDGLACLKLIDFGISRVDAPLSPKDAIDLTNPDVVMGSPRYMPPEQMESAKTADMRSDIWGLGAILYELLCGDAPFDGDSLMDIYAAVVRCAPPAPSSKRGDVPAELDAVILRCLAVDPADRFGDVAELAAALAPFGDERAAVRAEAIARVLEAARARGQGAADPVETSPSKSPSSRIRKRFSSSSRARIRRNVGLGIAGVALLGIGLAAKPIANRFSTPVAAVGATTSKVTITEAPLPAFDATPDEQFGPPTPPPSLLAPFAPSASANTITPKALPPELARPSWRPPSSRVDERSLFEERK